MTIGIHSSTQLPDLPGLRFRQFRGAEDFPGMVEVALASGTADGQERMDTVAGMTEAALAADGSSAGNVAGLYERCGFQVVTRDVIYRKPL